MDRQDDHEYGQGQEGEHYGEYHDLPGVELAGPKRERNSLSIKENFNPLQRAPKGFNDKTFDKFRKSRLVTAINGYHHISKSTPTLKLFVPNIGLILSPSDAKDNREFFGLGTEILNPFAPIASLLVHAAKNLDKDNNAGFALLMIPTVPIAFLALLVDLVETMVKYIALAIPALVAYPIMSAIDKRNEEQGDVGYPVFGDERRISI